MKKRTSGRLTFRRAGLRQRASKEYRKAQSAEEEPEPCGIGKGKEEMRGSLCTAKGVEECRCWENVTQPDYLSVVVSNTVVLLWFLIQL